MSYWNEKLNFSIAGKVPLLFEWGVFASRGVGFHESTPFYPQGVNTIVQANSEYFAFYDTFKTRRKKSIRKWAKSVIKILNP